MIETINGSTATEEEVHLLLSEDITVTATPFQTKEVLLSQIIVQIENLEQSSELSSTELQTIQEEMKKLPNSSEEYMGTQFRLRSLRRRLDGSLSVSSKMVKRDQQMTFTENYLIQQAYEPYINLGKDGRQWVASRIENHHPSTIESVEISKEADYYISVLRKSIEQLTITKSEKKVDELAEQLDLSILNEEIVMKEQLIQSWVSLDRKDFVTLTQIHKRFIALRKKIEESGIYRSTVDVDSLIKYSILDI